MPINSMYQSLTHTLYDLAAHPECLQPLRTEIETVLASEGWTNAGLNKMRKLDSFLKESHRWNTLSFGLPLFSRNTLHTTLIEHPGWISHRCSQGDERCHFA